MATLPFLYKISERTQWYTFEQLADMVAVSESTPGPIGVNMATYVGFTTAGLLGSLVATIGLITPEIIIILIISKALSKFRDNTYVDSAFYGLRPCSLALIASACILMCKITFITESGISVIKVLFALVLFVLTRYVPKISKLHPLFFIAFSALIGIVLKF